MEKSNIDEKIKLLTGSGMWHTQEVEGLPSVHLSDGPHGLRKQEEKERQNNVSLVSTCYPTASALACSWDVTAAERLGRAVAKEAWNADVAVLLGPGINMKRSPLCGRNFEYFSEDPFLAGRLGAAYVSAAQGEDVASISRPTIRRPTGRRPTARSTNAPCGRFTSAPLNTW